MVKLLTIMHHLTLCITCIAFILVSHTCIFFDRPCGARTRGTAGASTRRGREPRAGPRQPLVHLTIFLELTYLCILFRVRECALGYRSCGDTLVALR
jgi:hypothetical protein